MKNSTLIILVSTISTTLLCNATILASKIRPVDRDYEMLYHYEKIKNTKAKPTKLQHIKKVLEKQKTTFWTPKRSQGIAMELSTMASELEDWYAGLNEAQKVAARKQIPRYIKVINQATNHPNLLTHKKELENAIKLLTKLMSYSPKERVETKQPSDKKKKKKSGYEKLIYKLNILKEKLKKTNNKLKKRLIKTQISAYEKMRKKIAPKRPTKDLITKTNLQAH